MSLGLTAIAAYQAFLNTMDDPGIGPARGRLNTIPGREIVFCHQCAHEWYRDEHNGLDCPSCQTEVTEIITPGESDPRPIRNPRPDTPPGFQSLREHNPWQRNYDDSDPDEADIEEHIHTGPRGSVFITQMIRTSSPQHEYTRRRRLNGQPVNRDINPNEVIQDFQNIMGNLIGTNVRDGRAGRPGQDNINENPVFFPFGPIPLGGNDGHGGPPMAGRFTFTTGGSGATRDHDNDLFGLLRALGDASPANGAGGFPPALHGLLSTLLNPANARQGDAVYSQEALDQIISTLMEQHTASNAPGPAPADAIASLPKRKLDEELLGPEGKGECSVCMDDVHIGSEVVVLPCTHWFHQECAATWLQEHNTCPICRKGLETDKPTQNNSSEQSSQSGGGAGSSSAGGPVSARRNNSNNSAAFASRLASIRNVGQRSAEEEQQGIYGGIPPMPGSFSRRNSERGNTSGSDNSRSSRRSSRRSSNSGNATGASSGAMAWLRDRLGGNQRRNP